MSAWLHSSANFLTVLGALVIFFSWLTSNTLKTKLDELRGALRDAKNSQRLDIQHAELRSALRGIATQTFQPRGSDPGFSREEREYWSALDTFATTSLNSGQIDELLDLCERENRYSGASPKRTSASKELLRMRGLAFSLYRELHDEIDRVRRVTNEVHVMNPRPPKELARAIASVEAFDALYRQKLLPRVHPLYDEVVPLINARRQELDAELATRTRWAKMSSRAAVSLYVMGTVLALAGQAGDKLLGGSP